MTWGGLLDTVDEDQVGGTIVVSDHRSLAQSCFLLSWPLVAARTSDRALPRSLLAIVFTSFSYEFLTVPRELFSCLINTMQILKGS